MRIVNDLPEQLSAEQSSALHQLDREIKAQTSAEHSELARQILLTLAGSGDARSLSYVHQVFEESPNRRGDAAQGIARLALSGPRRAADWRLLVRSLPVVEGQQARDVLQALLQFNQRSNNGSWHRYVLLAGLKLDEEVWGTRGKRHPAAHQTVASRPGEFDWQHAGNGHGYFRSTESRKQHRRRPPQDHPGRSPAAGGQRPSTGSTSATP